MGNMSERGNHREYGGIIVIRIYYITAGNCPRTHSVRVVYETTLERTSQSWVKAKQ